MPPCAGGTPSPTRNINLSCWQKRGPPMPSDSGFPPQLPTSPRAGTTTFVPPMPQPVRSTVPAARARSKLLGLVPAPPSLRVTPVPHMLPQPSRKHSSPRVHPEASHTVDGESGEGEPQSGRGRTGDLGLTSHQRHVTTYWSTYMSSYTEHRARA